MHKLRCINSATAVLNRYLFSELCLISILLANVQFYDDQPITIWTTLMTNCGSVLQNIQALILLLPTCSSTVHSWLNVSGLFGWQILPLIICQSTKSGSHVRRLTQDKKIMGTPPFEELFTYELPGTLSQSVWQRKPGCQMWLEMCHWEDAEKHQLFWVTNKILLGFRECSLRKC